MSAFKVSRYLDDDHRLVDPDLVSTLRAKLARGEALDLEGVRWVAPAILDALLDQWAPKEASLRLLHRGPEVEAAFTAWAARQERPVQSGARARPRVQVRAPVASSTGAAERGLLRTPAPEDRHTPTRLVHRLRESLRGYIESAYPLSDPTLVRARRALLDTEAGGHLLAQDPFIETTTRYTSSPFGYRDLGLPFEMAEMMARLAATPTDTSTPSDPRTVLYPSMYAHQADAFHSFLVEGRDVVVATGTGSGKTECFLVPILGSLFDEATRRPSTFSTPGVRAMILYPMNALVNDQLSRLRLLFGEPSLAREFSAVGSARCPRFGMYTGRTPYPGPRSASDDGERVAPLMDYYLNMDPELTARLKRLGRYPAKDLRAFFGKHHERTRTYQTGRNAGKEYVQHNWDRRLHTSPGDRELLTRHEMVHGTGSEPGHAPDILITNYSMLEYMLMRPFERPIWHETQRWLAHEGSRLILVLDEAHMYRGARGAEVAFLIRRLRARLGVHERPDKLRVIATSASLGQDPSALVNVCRFAADLTGKAPEDFKPITGSREIPAVAAVADADEARMLASLDLGVINRTASAQELREALAPLFAYYGHPGPGDGAGEAQVLAALHQALDGRPALNLLIRESAASACALEALAQRVFPGHPQSRRAMESLLTLGTLAHRVSDAPGLLPTRLHALFRGLHGLYACINPRCAGRQADPGQPAILGKVFATPRATCDACGSRVFELASCRSCGSPYLLTYTEIGTLGRLQFLWGETEGNLMVVQLLPSSPRYPDRTEEIQVHLQTGYLDQEHRHPGETVRSLWLWRDPDGTRQPMFDRCAMCQPAAPARARIYDFRTRGEQPFTALIEAQFAEQPPQKRDPRLTNHGRKVLVFSDGRQKAARLAPALEHSHARDLFRQVLVLAARALEDLDGSCGMHLLYPAVVWLCGNRGYDLFPATDETEFHNHLRRVMGRSLNDALKLAHRGGLRPTTSYARALFSEMTDRYYSLPALALGTIEEDPVLAHLFADFPEVGLGDDGIRALFRAWVRLHLERRSFRPDGAELPELGEGWQGPVGINAERQAHVLPNRFDAYLQRVVGEDPDAFALVAGWFQRLVRNSDLLDFEGDLYYLRPTGLALRLRLDGAWLRCVDCGRIHPEALDGVCPACLGSCVDVDHAYLDARTGFYRDQVLRAFDERALEPFGLSAAEHSAQLTGQPDESAFNKVEEYELRFQDVPLDGKPPIDVLSCTTTMEVGIDIGALSGVALRNVPPHVANYQQRAGRAGRRGRSIASVVTYAHGSSHDAWFFEHPEAMVSGAVRPPIVYVENQQVLERHIHAWLVQRFFHQTVPVDPQSRGYQLFASLGTVGQFLSEEFPCSLGRLERWLKESEASLVAELRCWVPTFSHGLQEPISDVERTIVGSVARLLVQLRQVLPVEDVARIDEIQGLEREILDQRLDQHLLSALIGVAVFPRYAFPTDVVSFWVPKQRRAGEASGRMVFDYEPQRDLQLALSEYAPGRSLTIDKWRFESAALFSPYEPTPGPTLARRQPYTSCRSCAWVSLEPALLDAARCPCCGEEGLVHTSFITPAGFAPDINERREVDRGQPVVYAGITDRARLEVQDPPGDWTATRYGGRLRLWTGPRRLAMVNKGIGDRGFRVCPDCGRAEPEAGPGFTTSTLLKGGAPVQHRHPIEQGRICTGIAAGPFYLGHRFPTDALLLRLTVCDPLRLGTRSTAGLLSRAARMALTSLVEAISLAASRELQIDEGELSGWWNPVLGGKLDEAQLYLYDLLPGGAGYARTVGATLDPVLEATRRILQGCDCATSCYRCIRHYGNNYIHASLDRHLALALLQHVLDGSTPRLNASQVDRSVAGLHSYLRLRGFDVAAGEPAEGVPVPLSVYTPRGEVWVDVHHPLVDPTRSPSAVVEIAQARFREVVQLDAFALEHDLPSAVAMLRLPSGAPA